jgi:hypoxanthine phosphoribosyltransferase
VTFKSQGMDPPYNPEKNADYLEILSKEQLTKRVGELGRKISEDYQGKDLLMVGILKGAFIFLSDLYRSLSVDAEVDFIAVSSYGSATKTSGVVRIIKDLDRDLSNKDVLVVEDIVDSGLTLSYLRRNLLLRKPASLKLCSLLVKKDQQRTSLDLDYVGFYIDPGFVVGYGLDLDEKYRNLNNIVVLGNE